MRKQALAWLNADLAAWTKLLAQKKPTDIARAKKVLHHWRSDPDLRSMRDGRSNGVFASSLSEPERSGWDRLWRDVAILIYPELAKVHDVSHTRAAMGQLARRG